MFAAEQVARKILQQEGHIVQRILVLFPLGVDGLNDLFKRTILMLLRFQNSGSDLRQNFQAGIVPG